ncbi:unnamed protein product [Mesocestoides corti]|uniref:Uncharacterized protein n=2 Tax=Mesocestoides corti TaxID=53468 RepID=A0A0R3UDT8_MESCO|nr:unnamed protein product [Mesocestoides corti]
MPSSHPCTIHLYTKPDIIDCGKSDLLIMQPTLCTFQAYAVDARWIQSTRSCRQRYVCDHSCDPGAGHACICQRGYRPAGPEDRSRLIGYATDPLSHGVENRLGFFAVAGRSTWFEQNHFHLQIRSRIGAAHAF